ncbi:3-hydroxyacyl-CoA dehydrogenase [Phyllobacterium sp. 0TCS1.6C]|uniref:3-hydroxyacyl-CoA dehydrogenase n=1 Tax=unclassified Phyllobacterium TaxID=2638441 RepID=UPI0022645D3C|nr:MULTISPECIES: 3-hydroxyacyl-CoA dehydrogenase [unclassified Phyllobacterium]MCX8279001.1 3-hydroxyacyl-CoA dehydrogenase [Phyllobacterium sp. 0TCS1.6C]MCX8293785.1 3-hydroxyacyl-CoA dehydrogenase [Phyllobacterium sp. 0TCS1.6A]
MKAINNVAIVGAGLVGQGWAIVFARAGMQVSIYDERQNAKAGIFSQVENVLADLVEAGLCDDAGTILSRIRFAADLKDAVAGCDYVQESVFERIDVKREVSRAIDAFLPAHAVVGSSTSGFPGSAFYEDCRNRKRMMVVHPVNPPHLVPLVEIVPTPWTAPEEAARIRQLMGDIGQSAVSLSREIPGFVLNRLQGALLDEAFALYAEGYATAEDIDRTVRDGLGLRWAFMGPFETIDLNAPKGLADYAVRLGPMYSGFAGQRNANRNWVPEAIAGADAERREVLPSEQLDARRSWRDKMLMRIIKAKR